VNLFKRAWRYLTGADIEEQMKRDIDRLVASVGEERASQMIENIMRRERERERGW
jgi:hypothetical protein